MENLKAKLVAQLAQVQGSAIASITAETAVTLKGGKKNPLQGKVTKRAENANVMFFTNTNSNAYNNMVRRRLEAEGKHAEDFTLGKRVWGERIDESPFIQHKGQLYVEVVFLAPPQSVKYFVDGAETDKAQIPGLPEDTKEGKQGGLDNKVILRTYKLDSIKQVKMGALSFNA